VWCSVVRCCTVLCGDVMAKMNRDDPNMTTETRELLCRWVVIQQATLGVEDLVAFVLPHALNA
jgi:hypothetical protein